MSVASRRQRSLRSARCVGDEVEIARAVASCVKGVSCAASVSRPQIVALADPQQVLLTVGLHVNAWPRPKRFARLNERGKTLEREGERHEV